MGGGRVTVPGGRDPVFRHAVRGAVHSLRGGRRRLLLIDDDTHEGYILSHRLGPGWDVVQVLGLDEAGPQLHAGADVVLVDAHLPDMDWREVYRKAARMMPRGQIWGAYTGMEDPAQLDGLLQAGGRDVIPKDVGSEDLVHRIERMLATRVPPPSPRTRERVIASNGRLEAILARLESGEG